MIELRVSGADEAPEIIRTWPATKAVTLLGKRDAHRVPCQGPHHLVLYFDDTERLDDKQWVSVSPWHIQRVLEHTADLQPGDRLLVHCKAGKSRSTAMAIAVMIQHGMSAEEAFQHVKGVRSIMKPNRLMIRFIDDHFGLGGELELIVAEYYEDLEKEFPGIRMPDRGGWNL